MKQVFLSGAGQIEVLEVPLPGRLSNSVLVRNAYSLISSGTEGAAVTRHAGWLGLYEKVRSSSDSAGRAWDLVQKFGYQKAWEMIRDKLSEYTMIGYSCAGEVVETDTDEVPYMPGQRVACMGGGFANHAEYVVVPTNLMVALPDHVPFEEAAFAAAGCIAMQGLRRLELTPGERVGVIGLGLIGQVCARLLVAMGYRAFGVDLSAERAAKAANVPGLHAWSSSQVESVGKVMELTEGQGLDGVIICAASESDEPVNLAFDLCRQRGRVSVVGDVGLQLQRAKMYQKEIELRLSCSYGPGRYDPEYEVIGRDYPFGHVRWTERRNLEYFIELLGTGGLDVRPLVSKRFPVERAPEAYAQVKQGDIDTYGVLLDYGLPASTSATGLAARRTVHVPGPPPKSASSQIKVGLIGVGGYAKAVHIPNLKALAASFAIRAVASRSGSTAGVVGRKIGAPVATSDYHALLADPEIQAVIVSTRHASHAQIVLDALEAEKHVFVEKPMATTLEDARMIEARAAETGLVLRVGFNRRFSPYLNAMRRAIGSDGVRMFSVRVNIGPMQSHWSNTLDEGGRLLGEGCHFFDLCNWFIGAEPVAVSAMFAGNAEVTNPNAVVVVSYPDGSTAQVLYTTLGHGSMPKEYFEAFGNGRAVRSEDFRSLQAFGISAGVSRRKRGDKGQLAELAEFAAAIRGNDYPIKGADARAGFLATWMALAAYESARSGAASQLPD